MVIKKRKSKSRFNVNSNIKSINKNKKVSVSAKNLSNDKKMDLILKKLESIEKSQKVIESEEEQIIKEEDSVLAMEKKEISGESDIERKEDEEIDELKKIESLEQNIKEGMKDSPLKRITYRDVTKGIIGAFFGIIGHFAFVEGTHLSEDFSFLRSTLLLVTSFVIILIFLYFSGFRKVEDKFVFEFLPVRAIVIFFSSIITVFFVLLIYDMIGADTSFMQIYNSVAAISILAVIGAGTADLIGKNE
jgi:uncharacterized membrane protein